jgi:hypothetical protein
VGVTGIGGMLLVLLFTKTRENKAIIKGEPLLDSFL